MDDVSKNKGHLATAGFILVSLAAGIAIGLTLKGSSESKSCETAKVELTNKLVEQGYIQEDGEVLSLNGMVTEINGDAITLEVANVNQNPLSDPSPNVRKVTLSTGGTIVKRTMLPMEKQEADWNAYMEAESAYMAVSMDPENPPTIDPPVAPLGYVEEAITVADIKVGDRVTVQAETDIRLAEKISAKLISLQVQAETADVVPPVVEEVNIIEPTVMEEPDDLNTVPTIE